MKAFFEAPHRAEVGKRCEVPERVLTFNDGTVSSIRTDCQSRLAAQFSCTAECLGSSMMASRKHFSAWCHW